MKDNDMGNPKNITLTTIAEGAMASQEDGKETLEHIKELLNETTPEEIDKKIEELKQKSAQ